MKNKTPELEPFDEKKYLASVSADELREKEQRLSEESERARIIMEGLKPIADLPEIEPVEGGTHIDITDESTDSVVSVRSGE